MSIISRFKIRRDIKTLRKSGLFNEEWYRDRYLRDQKKWSERALEHYCRFGWKEGFNPNPDFEGDLYIKLHMTENEYNPFMHYLRCGRFKGYEGKFCSDLETFANNLDRTKKNILFVGHDFSLSGAPSAVLNTAIELKKKGFGVASLAFRSGPLAKIYEKNEIEYFISEKYNGLFEISVEDERRLEEAFSKFDFIFCNTVLACNIFERIKDKIPHLWRIAEGDDIKKKYAPAYPEMEDILSRADQLYAVSEYTEGYLRQYNDNVSLLLYGFPDVSEKYLNHYDLNAKKKKVKFCTIGYYSERKAQDLIIEAYRKLPEDLQEKVEITFVGTGFEKFENEEGLYFVGPKVDNEKYEILADCDVLLCPSLDDPNPQVVMEGMMMHKTCIVSDMVGQKDYITDGEDGFIVKAGDVEALTDLMKKIVEKPEILDYVGKKSYDLYQKYFCFDKYIAKVISIIEEKL